jgi:drug/metabolite transporter superfamily protein YnfA
VIRKIFQIILWLAAGAYVVVGVLAITGVLGSAREADSLGRAYAVFGSMILMIGAMAAVATFLANKWPGWLFVALLVLCETSGDVIKSFLRDSRHCVKTFSILIPATWG